MRSEEAILDEIREAEEVERRTVRGAAGIGLTQLGTGLLEMVKMIVLARLLSPRDFGLVALCYLLIEALRLFSNVGTGAALIYQRERVDRVADVAFWLNVAVGMGLFLIALGLAPIFVWVYQEPAILGMIYVLAFTLLVQAVGMTHHHLLEKRLAFGTKALAILVPHALATAAAIWLAFLQAGAWSIIWSQLLNRVLGVLVVWAVFPWRPHWRFDRETAQQVVAYGKHVLGARLAIYLVSNVDYALVGRALGAHLLGLYHFGYERAGLIYKYIIRDLADVFFPAFSLVREEREKLQAGYLKTLQVLGAVALPTSVGMLLLAREFVVVIFGDKWLPAVPVLQVLLLWSITRSLCVNVGSLSYALGRPDVPFKVYTLKFVCLVPALVVTVPQGIFAVAVTVTVVQLTTDLGLMVFTHRLLGLSNRAVLRALGPAFLGTAVMTAVLLPGRVWQDTTEALPQVAFFLGALIAGTLVYAGLLFGLSSEMRNLARTIGKALRGERSV
ncbi:MAG TPA: lipopolysaccharide biosynthesis protein [Armatimonadetes bacterium]|nr:lipopolysaccharide biosynthesis protein [Armatimonadota bacterium]